MSMAGSEALLRRLKDFGQLVRHIDHRVMSAGKLLCDPARTGLGIGVNALQSRRRMVE